MKVVKQNVEITADVSNEATRQRTGKINGMLKFAAEDVINFSRSVQIAKLDKNEEKTDKMTRKAISPLVRLFGKEESDLFGSLLSISNLEQAIPTPWSDIAGMRNRKNGHQCAAATRSKANARDL